MRTRTKAKIAGKTAKAMVDHPGLRRVATTAGPPVVRVRFGIARRRARRRALERATRVQEAAQTVSEILSTYGPQAAEVLGMAAEALGVTEPPERSKRGPAIAAGAALGAGVVLLLEPGPGKARRAKLIGLVSGG